MIRILAVSDDIVDWIHGPKLYERRDEFDAVISCGDLPLDYLEFIASSVNKPCYYVHGNHDSYGISRNGELKTEPAGWINLEMNRVKLGKHSLAGLGGCHRYKPGVPHQYSQAEMRARAFWLSRRFLLPRMEFGRGVDILVTHSPPYGIHDGNDLAHTGFEVFNWLVARFRPKFLLHGHQHRNYAPRQAGQTIVGDTQIINVHPYCIIEL